MMIDHGIHDGIPFADYLSGAGIPSPAISGSDIANLDSECPAYAFAFWRANPDREESEDTTATSFGTAAHCAILEGTEAYRSRYRIKPAGMNFATKDGKAWRDDGDAREILTHAEDARAWKMCREIRKDATARMIMTSGGKAEQTMIARDPVTGLTLLARPDLFIARSGLLVNLKTANDPSPRAFERQVWSLRYYLSDAFVRYVAKLCGVDKPSHAFLVIGSKPPHLGYVAALKPDAAEWGDKQVRILIDQFATCVESGVWPSYASGVLEIGLPVWAGREVSTKLEGVAA